MHQQVAPIEIYVKRAKQGKKQQQQQQQQKRKKLFADNKHPYIYICVCIHTDNQF